MFTSPERIITFFHWVTYPRFYRLLIRYAEEKGPLGFSSCECHSFASFIQAKLTFGCQEPILKRHIGTLFLDVSCSQGRNSRANALKQPFESKALEDSIGGPNHLNALRRQNEIETLVAETLHGYPSRDHLYIKLKVDFMSHMDLVGIFGLFHALDKRITLEELCTIQGGHDSWPTVKAVDVLYGEVSAEAALQAGLDWILRDLPTASEAWAPFAEFVNYGQIMYKRTTVWDKRR